MQARPARGVANVQGVNGQYVAYTFFRVDPAWRRLPVEERARGEGRVRRGDRGAGRRASTTCAPTRRRASGPETDFFLWKITERYEDLGELGAALNATPLAAWLDTPVLVPRDDEGVAVHVGAEGAEDHCRRARRTSSSTRS